MLLGWLRVLYWGGACLIVGPVFAEEDPAELFPFESQEYSQWSAAPTLDSAGGRGLNIGLNSKFLSGTRLIAGGGYSDVRNSSANSYSWSFGLLSSAQEDFAFGVFYEGWRRNTPKETRCGRMRINCVETQSQLRQTSVEGVRTSLTWSSTHVHIGLDPVTQRIVLANDLISQELFSVGARASAGVFGFNGWDMNAWAGDTTFSRSLKDFANFYSAPGGARTLDLRGVEFGFGAGYTWNPWHASASWSQARLVVSGKVE
ncbi:MAG: hypothetical protein OEW08_07285, partial [Gammaproteobacteria bacterium]|nr:hypothetical protein [Gammaproteobacteria bacterium]